MPIQESFIQLAKKPASGPRNSTGGEWETMQKQVGVLKLISAYRVLGSRQANLDPLKRMDQETLQELDPVKHGLTDADMAVQFNVGSLVAPQKLPLSDILSRLKQTYCGNIGLEFMHITKSDESTGYRSALKAICPPRATMPPRKCASSSRSPRPRPWNAICIPNTLARSASRWKVANPPSLRWII
jgi:2-oxoglutarate dehydrogenase complex dehydrogenase (E1) component-like enzyme